MKYFQMDATNSQTGQHIIERFLEDGTRFIKHIPFNPTIYIKLKTQFSNKNVSVELGSNKWIRIAKTGENLDLKAVAEQSTGKTEITQEEIVNIEADMLKKAGFIVVVEEKEE